MKLKRICLLIGIMALVNVAMAQQRAITSTYAYNGLTINPAYAGSLNVLSVIGVNRKQWINQAGAPETSLLTAHTSLASNQVGVGLFAMKDKIGVHEDVAFYGSYAYKIKTSIGILAMGLQGGFNSRASNFSDLNLLSPDPALSGTVRRFSPNFGTGLYFANPYFYAGFAVPYIVQNKTFDIPEGSNSDIVSRESRYYYFSSGIVLPLSSNVKLSPTCLLRAQENTRVGWDLAANLIFESIAYLGVNVRNNGELTFFGQVILNENMRIGYAYEATTNALANNSAGSHEILLNYRIKLKNYRKDPQCPVYF